MKTLIQQARDAVVLHNLAASAKEEEDERQRLAMEAAKLKLVNDWVMTAMVTCREDILVAAGKGYTTRRVPVATFEDRVSETTTARAKALTELLELEGFTVSQSEDREDPVGSDPYFATTVYSTYLDVSWA